MKMSMHADKVVAAAENLVPISRSRVIPVAVVLRKWLYELPDLFRKTMLN
jgi:hypothetical protein